MTADELNAGWQSLETPAAPGTLAGRLASDTDRDLRVTLAVDHEGLRHLLIPVRDDADPPATPQTKGLELKIDELQVSGQDPRTCLDIACRDPGMHANFSMVAAEIVAALVEDSSAVIRTVERILERWRWFWGAPAAGLSDESIIGLFGELWFLEHWLGPIDHETLAIWRGPLRDRHDFKWPAASVEVKATRARTDGAAAHHITSLDQLEDPDRGRLHLFSLRVTPDPIGTHSLVASIDRVRQQLVTKPDVLRAFDERLGRAGYSPAHRHHYTATVRVVSEELYAIRDAFPRLTSASFVDGVPGGIDNIAYTLNLGACRPWRIATRPTEGAAEALRSSLRESSGVVPDAT